MASDGETCWVFGYGSLICADSRARSGHSGTCIPVVVSGLRRSWSAAIPLGEKGGAPTPMMPNPNVGGVTAVSVANDDASSCNGVIVEVPASEMAAFDAREKGYTRQLVPLERITLHPAAAVGSIVPEGASVWVYVAAGSTGPTGAFPIIQSYVDVILLGAAQVSCRRHAAAAAAAAAPRRG